MLHIIHIRRFHMIIIMRDLAVGYYVIYCLRFVSLSWLFSCKYLITFFVFRLCRGFGCYYWFQVVAIRFSKYVWWLWWWALVAGCCGQTTTTTTTTDCGYLMIRGCLAVRGGRAPMGDTRSLLVGGCGVFGCV